MSDLEIIVSVFVMALGLFTAGHIIGYHRGWQDGYWTEHPVAVEAHLEEEKP